jgi:hypothetical protein
VTHNPFDLFSLLKQMNAKDRYLLRRAAVLLGVPIPPEAERRYLTAEPVRYWLPPGYEPTTQELVAVRQLCRDSGREFPDWARNTRRLKMDRRCNDGR